MRECGNKVDIEDRLLGCKEKALKINLSPSSKYTSHIALSPLLP